MKTVPRHAGGVTRPRGKLITPVLAREFELSTTLNRLIGAVNCEAALLPNQRTVSEWSREDVHDSVFRCQNAVIAALRCAIRLQALDDLDAYSELWICEALEQCDASQDLLNFVRSQLIDCARG
jgi:hypothetical protein